MVAFLQTAIWMPFVNENCYLIKIPLMIVHMGLYVKKSSVVHVMVWRRI